MHATVTAAPPFALDLAIRVDKSKPLREKLKIRHCILGAERIDWDVVARMSATFVDRGFGLDSMTSAYGLAEATLAVTAGDPETAPIAVDVDPEALAEGLVRVVEPESGEEAMRFVSSGKALPGMAVAIDDEVGEIRIDSPCLANGYFKNEAATAERFSADGFRTADLGFQVDDELFVAGRTDDLIVVRGKNLYVEALEEEIAERKGIRKGNCAIVAAQSGQRQILGLVAEVKRSDEPDLSELEPLLKRQVLSTIGASVDKVVFLPPGSFPKTPSGKVQRFRCRQIISEQAKPAASVAGEPG
jgi:acyl-CoA synthetase (AMP-forming)/AMP-acid ligase II